jgi:hypothetical protein
MVHEVNYNGEIHEFPDEATPEMISRALGLQEAQPQQPQKNVVPEKRNLLQMLSENPLNPLALMKAAPQMGSDILSMIGSGVEKLGQAPSEISGAYNLLKENPTQAGRAALAGLPTMGHELLNAPSDIGNYLQRLGLAPKELTEKIPRQKDITEDINKTFKLTGSPGEALLTGLVSNIPSIASGAQLGKKIATYPSKFSAKSIMENIVKTGKEQSKKFEIEYGDLFKKAESRKVGNFDLNNIDEKTIKLRANPKYTEALDDFLKEPTLENAQSAQSDLGKYIDFLDNKPTLTKKQQKSLKASKDARQYIKENMFKDKEGKLHEDLLNEYEKINARYPSEKLSYSQNKAIKAYKKGELVPKEALQKISKGKFYAQRGSAHPEIDRRSLAKILGIGIPTIYGAYEGGKGILNYLLGK